MTADGSGFRYEDTDGQEEAPARQGLRLSDAFLVPKEGYERAKKNI